MIKLQIPHYKDKGINRISFGIQDFDPQVQKAVNRIQPIELIEEILTPEIKTNFQSISFDILYGLPKQSVKSFNTTIQNAICLSPDRIVLLSYNHSPKTVGNQKGINSAELPTELQKAQM